jgi:riboflavin-specific deaminase-like protein
VQQLYPRHGDVDVTAIYAYPERLDRPYVRANMVSSIDGAASVEGRSGGLSSPTDKQIFTLLRALADVVLVGAGTVRAEGYGPGRIRTEYAALRARHGQPPEVPIAIVSISLDLDLRSALFREARPLVITCAAADSTRRTVVAADADLIVAGEQNVDLTAALSVLGERGLRRVLCEGGPRLLGDLLHSRQLDELCLTVAPVVVGGDAPRIAISHDARTPMALRTLLEESGTLFARYVRA